MDNVKRVVNLNDIVIPNSFLESSPKQNKIEKKNKEFENGKMKSHIVLNEKNELLDGYATYLVLKNHNVKETDCYYNLKNFNRQLYVYAKHYENNDKEYVWYLPSKFSNEVKSIKKGQKILVSTKNGVVPAYVTKIVTTYLSDDISSNEKLRRVVKINNVW